VKGLGVPVCFIKLYRRRWRRVVSFLLWLLYPQHIQYEAEWAPVLVWDVVEKREICRH
jgi:hypothetical protein